MALHMSHPCLDIFNMIRPGYIQHGNAWIYSNMQHKACHIQGGPGYIPLTKVSYTHHVLSRPEYIFLLHFISVYIEFIFVTIIF